MKQKFSVFLLLCLLSLTTWNWKIKGADNKVDNLNTCRLDIYANAEDIKISPSNCKYPVAFKRVEYKETIGRDGEQPRYEAVGARMLGMSQREMLNYGSFITLSEQDNPCQAENGLSQRISCDPKTTASFGRSCHPQSPDFYIATFCYENWEVEGFALSDFDAIRSYAINTDRMMEEMTSDLVCTMREEKGEGVTSLISMPELDYAIVILWKNVELFQEYQLLINERQIYE